MKQQSLEKKRALASILKRLHISGINAGVEIAGLAKKIHKHSIVIPLYRSCMAITPKNGYAVVDMYGDPMWMGAKKITIEGIKAWHKQFVVQGQRSGPDILINDGESRVNIPLNVFFYQKHLDEDEKRHWIEKL